MLVTGLIKHGHTIFKIKIIRISPARCSSIFEGLSVSNDTIQKLNTSGLFDPGAILILGTADLQSAVGIGPVESAILLSWAKQKEREELREEKERERENKKALKIASRKTIYVYHDGSASEFSIADQTEFDRLLSIFSALQEVDLLQEPVNKKVILSWEQLQDSKLYLPLKSAVKVDVQTLHAEILNLAKSKAEFSAKKHIQDYWQLHSTHDVDYVGSEVQLQVRNGDIMGDIDTLFRIQSRKTFVLMERKTTVGVNAAPSLLEQVVSSLFFSCKIISILFCYDVFFLTAFEDSVGVPNSSARRRVPQEVQLGARGDVFRDKELAVLHGGRSGGCGEFTSEGTVARVRLGSLTVFSLATWLLLREG